MKRKRIGVTMSEDKSHFKYDLIYQNYITFYFKCGLFPILLPNNLKYIKQALHSEHWDGFVLTGGGDINTRFFSKKSRNRSSSYVRENCEMEIVKYAVNKNIPILGVCRGFQFLNMYFGGTIFENERLATKHINRKHQVEIISSKYQRLFNSQIVIVNSFHKHCILENGLSKNLRMFCKTADNIIEGYFHPQYPIVGIQWHPERNVKTSSWDIKLIKKLFFNI